MTGVFFFASLYGGLAHAEELEKVEAEAWSDHEYTVQISPAVRMERARIIRDTAASLGMTNAVLLAGIGEVETNFSHCWSEATWACKGPNSSSCDGGPVIAGASDGPCSAQQGGLGLFQFDAGTFSDTISTYGPSIVTMSGNVGAVVPFLVTRAVQSVTGVNTEEEAIAWMNSIPIVDGDPLFEDWLYFVAWRYNGCMGCTSQQNKYRRGTHTLLDEMGADFWQVEAGVPTAPADCEDISVEGRTIEESDACFVTHGPQQFWRYEAEGNAGALAWTKTTDSAAASNYGVWNLVFQDSQRFKVEVYAEGQFAQSTQASYTIEHAEGDATVVVNQLDAGGWIDLGTYSFASGELYKVTMGDNTGENTGVNLAFDALRASPVAGAGGGEGGEGGGGGGGEDKVDSGGISGCGCSSTDSQGGSLWLLALSVLFLFRPRKIRDLR